jgi:EAL domain-containing protein (putative c-di-GMP-specific phosphodiesterase class I)
MEQLAKTSVPLNKLCFEITETAAIASLDKATHFMIALKREGCRFALDDFGSGLSSFGYLRTLPVDYLKIDGAIVKEIAVDDVALSMVSAIHQIADVMGIETIAEFVENDAIKDKLRSIGVDFGQGYGIAKPRPLDELLTELNQPQRALG